MITLPVVKDHLPWETTKFGGSFIQVSLHNVIVFNYTMVLFEPKNDIIMVHGLG